ncbi:MAG: hypothetical protein V1887_02815 [Candidatus Aenigmatarchaeota archaeon]
MERKVKNEIKDYTQLFWLGIVGAFCALIFQNADFSSGSDMAWRLASTMIIYFTGFVFYHWYNNI